MAHHEVVEEAVAGLECVALVSPDAGLRAGFAVAAGMVGYSLTHRGEELLGQRGGLTAYRERGSTFGIPLLYPWANRLSSRVYSQAGQEVQLYPERSPVRLDPNGLPIHGLLAASSQWRLVARSAGEDRAVVRARLDFGAHEELLAAFPFPHELQLEVALAGEVLRVVTELAPTSTLRVPVSFGWHPYLQLTGVPRARWRVELPVRSRAVLDERGIPTGETQPGELVAGLLGGRAYDDLFPELDEPAVFALEGGGRRIELEFGAGYPVGQVYAPPDEDFISFEPMTAPTNALVTGAGLRSVAPGERFRAEFRIRVLG